MQQPNDHARNYLLGALPDEAWQRLAGHMQHAPMRLGDLLYKPNESLPYAWFPTTAIVSLQYTTESGAFSESAGVGSEGMVGIPLFMGGDTTPSSAVVLIAGHGCRIRATALKEEFSRGGALQGLLLRYAQSLITQVAQTAACNRHHSVEQQLCRWLLLTLDRLPEGELTMTQELVANVLGVRRESITAAAGKLQRAGLLSYRRGHMTVLQRTGLEDHACECYGVVRKEQLRLLSDAQRPLAIPAG